MKILLPFLLLFLFSCSGLDEKEIEDLNKQIEALEESKSQEELKIESYVKNLELIQSDMDDITSQQKDLIIRIKKDPKLLSEKDSSIQEEIRRIGAMIDVNNQNIIALNHDGDSSQSSVNQLMSIASTSVLKENNQINDLQEQLEAVDVAFEDLFSVFGETLAELDETRSSLNETKQFLNTVWYVVDSKKNLAEKDIITSEGGFIGIGKSEELQAEFNISHFTKANKKTLRKVSLPEGLKKAELITSHPQSSYSIQKGILTILNPNDFWSVSKYLVVSTK